MLLQGKFRKCSGGFFNTFPLFFLDLRHHRLWSFGQFCNAAQATIVGIHSPLCYLDPGCFSAKQPVDCHLISIVQLETGDDKSLRTMRAVLEAQIRVQAQSMHFDLCDDFTVRPRAQDLYTSSTKSTVSHSI